MINLFDLLRGIKRVILRNILKHFFSSFGKGSTYDPITSYIPRYQNISIGEKEFATEQLGSSVHPNND